MTGRTICLSASINQSDQQQDSTTVPLVDPVKSREKTCFTSRNYWITRINVRWGCFCKTTECLVNVSPLLFPQNHSWKRTRFLWKIFAFGCGKQGWKRPRCPWNQHGSVNTNTAWDGQKNVCFGLRQSRVETTPCLIKKHLVLSQTRLPQSHGLLKDIRWCHAYKCRNCGHLIGW